jgi:Na+-driven multidrug efflux pump
MASPALTYNGSDTLVRRTLLGNFTFSLLSGLLLLLASGEVASLFGVPQGGGIFSALGILILLFAPVVYWVQSRPALDTRLVWAIFALDVAWVVVSMVILLTNAFALSNEGRWAVLIVADIVAVFAVLEYIGLRRMR